MGKTTDNRIRKLERGHRPPPCREIALGWHPEEVYDALLALGKRALAGDADAEALFNNQFDQLLTRPPLPRPLAIAAIPRATD